MGDDCSPRSRRAGCNVDGCVTNCIVSEPAGEVRKIMNVRSDEPEQRGLMLAGLDGDAAAHKALLTRLSANLRAYFKTHLARIGKGPADAEDLVQETLIHCTPVDTPMIDQSLSRRGFMRSHATGWSTFCAERGHR